MTREADPEELSPNTFDFVVPKLLHPVFVEVHCGWANLADLKRT